MEGAHAHLLFNHFPIIGSIISVLVFIAGFLLKNNVVKKTALAIIVFSAVTTIPAFLSGEGAEDALEAIGQKPKALIHEHEEMAEIGLWTTLAVGCIALLSFFTSKKSYHPRLLVFIFAMLLGNTIFLAKIGNAGGAIRHTEIRAGNQPDVLNGGESEEED